eukprot:TRINITY_DN1691_c0_g1_i2.p1 TRINITY_DN1691_c0_g1~~TRINITY_DN1691_c0_g1_i2.p1  ORF type:complete len:309 (+),score=95.97 TRINITY_DN1691_c0_g1_i2:130-1056(+)
MIRRPPRSTLSSSSAASDVYKRQAYNQARDEAVQPPPFAHFRSYHERGVAHRGWGYVLKFCMVMTLNLGFSSGLGIKLALDERWDELSAGTRVKKVLWSVAAYWLRVLFLMQFSDLGNVPDDRDLHIYRKAILIRLSLERVRNTIGNLREECALTRECMRLLAGDLGQMDKLLPNWLGPKEVRYAPDSMNQTLVDNMAEIATEIDRLRRVLLRPDEIQPEAEGCESQHPLLATTWKSEQYFVVGVEDMPIDMLELDPRALQEDYLEPVRGEDDSDEEEYLDDDQEGGSELPNEAPPLKLDRDNEDDDP